MHEVDLFVLFIHGFVWVILLRECSAFAISAQKYYGLLQCPTLIYSVSTRVTKLLAQCH